MTKELYARMVAEHRCTKCGKPLPEGHKAKTCRECYLKNKKHVDKWLEKTGSKYNYNVEGKCRRCRCDLPSNYEYKNCKSCRIKISQERYEKKEERNERA